MLDKLINTVMKRFWILVLSLVIFSIPAMADGDRPISVDKMPQKAQAFITKYFSGTSVAIAKQEGGIMDKSYDVVFKNGDKVEFDRQGGWTNVDCKYTSVPDGIVPEKIAAYIKGNFSGEKVIQIEKEDRRYEVELSNGVELKFNYSFELLDVDF